MLANLSLVLLAVLTSGQALAAPAAPHWLFIETNTGLPADLDYGSSVMGVAEDALPAKVCANTEAYHCFSSSFGFEFAIPKKLGSQRKWTYGGRVYCVVGTASDIKGKGVANDSLIIRSRIGKTCDEGAAYDQSYLYSRGSGLRLISLTRSNRQIFQLISIDESGFPYRK